jgi:hypothetical protein
MHVYVTLVVDLLFNTMLLLRSVLFAIFVTVTMCRSFQSLKDMLHV